MTDIAPITAIVIALEVLRWVAGPTVTYAVAGIVFAFCVGALWGAGDMKRRLQDKQDKIKDIAP